MKSRGKKEEREREKQKRLEMDNGRKEKGREYKD